MISTYLNKICLTVVVLYGLALKAEFNYLGYGNFDYKSFETFKTTNNHDPYFREQLDLSEFALEGEYLFENGNEIEFEIEFEHGGTGVTSEYDAFEESGEFELEVERGGEVALSELNYLKKFNRSTGVRIGKFPLMIGLGTILSNPNNNISVRPSRLERNVIPVGWNEMGLQFEYKWWDIRARLALVNGLNSEYFRSYNWIGGGYQRQFEGVNAGGKAGVMTLEYGNVEHAQGLALSYYQGDAAANRYKLGAVSKSADVRLYSFVGNYRLQDWTFMGQYIRGSLDNAENIVYANSNLTGGARTGSFAPVGSQAVLEVAQVSYDIFEPLAVYGKHEFVNTFLKVDGNLTVYPRYEVTYKSLGFRWIIDERSQLKIEAGVEKTKLDGLPETRHYLVSFTMAIPGEAN